MKIYLLGGLVGGAWASPAMIPTYFLDIAWVFAIYVLVLLGIASAVCFSRHGCCAGLSHLRAAYSAVLLVGGLYIGDFIS